MAVATKEKVDGPLTIKDNINSGRNENKDNVLGLTSA